jgi:hypothetical protein
MATTEADMSLDSRLHQIVQNVRDKKHISNEQHVADIKRVTAVQYVRYALLAFAVGIILGIVDGMIGS